MSGIDARLDSAATRPRRGEARPVADVTPAHLTLRSDDEMSGPAAVRDAHDEDGGDDAAARDDARLVAGIRAGETDALISFAQRYRPVLLRQARRLGVAPDHRESAVDSLLDDLAMRIARGAAPRVLASYVIRSFRNAVLMERRGARSEHEAWFEATATDTRRAGRVSVGESVVAGSCSEYSVRAANRDPDNASCDEAMLGLVYHLLETIGERDLELLIWRSNHVPAREIAAWLGINYGAARARISRLCARLTERATLYRDGVHDAERHRLDRLFERMGIGHTSSATNRVVREESSNE